MLTDRQWWSRTDRPAPARDSTRMLDAATSRLLRGRGSAGVADVLRRLGVRFIVMRRDLTSAPQDDVNPELLRAGLTTTPGWSRAATFGVSSAKDLFGRSVGFGYSDPGPLLEVWTTDETQPFEVHPPDLTSVAGGPESVLALADAGTPDSATRPWSRDGAGHRPHSAAGVGPRCGHRPRPGRPKRLETAGTLRLMRPSDDVRSAAFARYDGIRDVSASSSASEPTSSGHRRLDSAPFAAVDGNPFTAWRSAAGDVVGAWWSVSLDDPTDLSDASATFVDSRLLGPRVNIVRVSTDAESVLREVLPGGEVFLDLTRPATRLRITVVGLGERAGDQDSVGIGQLLVPGLRVERTLVLPDGGAAASWVLAPDPATVGQCLRADLRLLCNPGVSLPGEDAGRLDRVIRTPVARTVPMSIVARPVPGPALRALLDDRMATNIRATASSTLVSDPVVRPMAAVDGDARTSWVAAVDDPAPVLRLRWATRTPITGLTLTHASTPVSSAPTRISVRTPGRQVEVPVDAEGRAVLPETITDRVDIEVLETSRAVTVDASTGGTIPLPVGVAEVRVDGAPAVRPSATTRWSPCRAVRVRSSRSGDGPWTPRCARVWATCWRSTMSRRDRAATRPGRLLPGGNRVRFVPSLLWSPVRVVLGDLPTARADRDAALGASGPAIDVRTGGSGLGRSGRHLGLGSARLDSDAQWSPAAYSRGGWLARLVGSPGRWRGHRAGRVHRRPLAALRDGARCGRRLAASRGDAR